MEKNMKNFKYGYEWFQKKRLRQMLAATACNLSMLVTCSGFIYLEPIGLWLTSEQSEISMNSNDLSWLASIIEITSFISGIPAGVLADRWGRKPLLLSVGPLCLLPWLWALFSRNLASLYGIRLMQGFAEGICFAVAPTYVAEISSPDIRGALGAHAVVLMYLGFVYTYCAGYYLNYQNYLYILAILPVIYFIVFLFMPESPYYYLMVNRKEEATAALGWLRGGEDVTEELNDIVQGVDDDMKRKGSWKDLIATRSDRRALFIVQIVNIAAYMTGVPTVCAYASQTFKATPLLWITAEQLTIIMSVVLTISAFLASFIIDTIGRRKLLIISSVGIAISNLVISIYYYLAEKTLVDISSMPWIMYLGVFALCVLTNVGVGELVHTIQGEFFPSHTRSIGGGVTTAVATLAIFFSVKAYQPLSDNFGVYMNFVSYTIISLIAAVLIIVYMNESTGRTLAQINQDINELTTNTDKQKTANTNV